MKDYRTTDTQSTTSTDSTTSTSSGTTTYLPSYSMTNPPPYWVYDASKYNREEKILLWASRISVFAIIVVVPLILIIKCIGEK